MTPQLWQEGDRGARLEVRIKVVFKRGRVNGGREIGVDTRSVRDVVQQVHLKQKEEPFNRLEYKSRVEITGRCLLVVLFFKSSMSI